MNTDIAARPLDGVRVFELGIAIAAPHAGRYLAHFGAEVIKIESRSSPDVVRLLGAAWLRDDEERAAAWEDSSPYVPEMNADKRSVALELKTPEGLEAAKRLLATCDVFLANFGARALRDLGLDYEHVAAVKSDIVYVQLPGFGSDPDTPYYPFVAWGPNQAPLVGIDELTGHAGREPAGIATVAPPDYLSALHATNAVLAGLEYRDRTGEGVHVDVAQFETTIGFLGPFVMDHDLTGRSQSRIGNRSLWHAPEGVYPADGPDRWVALSVPDDEAWRGLTTVLPDLAADDRFTTADDRLAHQDALDEALAEATSHFDPSDLAARLQAVGVAAHIVATNEDLLQDEHVKHAGWYLVGPGTRFTRDVYSGIPIRLSATPGRTERAGPRLGEDTREFLTSIAGYTSEEVDALALAGSAHTVNEPEFVLDRPYDPWLHVLFPGEPDARDL